MHFNDCKDDFIVNQSYRPSQSKAYNFLKAAETRITTPTTLLFADGETDGPTVLDEGGNVVSEPKLLLIKEVWTENPSEFLKENQELANSVKYLLMEVPTNE